MITKSAALQVGEAA